MPVCIYNIENQVINTNTKETVMTTTITKPLMYECEVKMEVEYYDVDNQTWENCSSDTYIANIDIHQDVLEKYYDNEDSLSEFFEWYVWMDSADRECFSNNEEDQWVDERHRFSYDTSELFYNPDTLRIIKSDVDVKHLFHY